MRFNIHKTIQNGSKGKVDLVMAIQDVNKISPNAEKFKSIFVRKEFTVNNPSAVSKMTLTIECVSVFIVYINGINVIQSKVSMFEELDITGFAPSRIIMRAKLGWCQT